MDDVPISSIVYRLSSIVSAFTSDGGSLYTALFLSNGNLGDRSARALGRLDLNFQPALRLGERVGPVIVLKVVLRLGHRPAILSESPLIETTNLIGRCAACVGILVLGYAFILVGVVLDAASVRK